ncbi:hypothetical protein E2C01_064801 [Portunus trituberculatus]|uniref:Uncharacterized protein n=1 Tax=Portunus trituberculatus TaxID=210409 RepID=A0A5B7HLB1_PORTR|nr:hypothetical protein [Portunus trituberculatus]
MKAVKGWLVPAGSGAAGRSPPTPAIDRRRQHGRCTQAAGSQPGVSRHKYRQSGCAALLLTIPPRASRPSLGTNCVAV